MVLETAPPGPKSVTYNLLNRGTARFESEVTLEKGLTFTTDSVANTNAFTATTATNAATINTVCGVITTESLTIAAATASSDQTITNSSVSATSIILLTIGTFSGTWVTHGTPIICDVTPGAGSFTFKIVNIHASNAMTAKTLKIHFQVINVSKTTGV